MIKPLRQIAIITGMSILVFGCHNANDKKAVNNNTVNPADTIAPDRPSPKPVIDSNAKEGLNTIYYSNGMIKAKGNCTGGLKVGEWQSFYQSGKLWSDEYFTGGLQDGQVTVYYENGQKMYEGQFKMGNQYGIWHYWRRDGSLSRTADYNKKSPNTSF